MIRPVPRAHGAMFALMLALGLPSSAPAQEALYAAPPPADAVFVRWLGDAADHDAARAVMGHTFSAKAAGPAYAAISVAHLQDAVEGGHYAVTVDSAGVPHVIAEPARTDRAKVHLFLASCDASPVKLVLAGQGVDVAALDAPHSMAVRAVNPVAASLAVATADGAVLGQFDVTLSRGQDITFFACNGAAQIVENAYGTVVKD